MKIITLEEHITDQRIMDANNAFNTNQPPMTPEQAQTTQLLMSREFVGEELADIENRRIPFMDANQIDMQVLSLVSPVSDAVPAEGAACGTIQGALL